jgi:hypothetical protein
MEGSGAGGNEEEYVHLDDDDLAYLEVPINEEAAESAAKHRALMASFEMQRRDESARHLMVAERKATVDELAASQQRARHSARRRNMVAAREVRETVERRQEEEERARAAALALARAREHQYPLPSYYPAAGIIEDAQRRRQQWREERLRRHLETGNHGGSAPATDGAGGSGTGGSGAGNSGAY